MLGPIRLPRQVSGLICAILYNPPDTPLPEQRNQVEYTIDQLDAIRTIQPDCGVLVRDDFNKLDIHNLLIHHNLKQVVHIPIRGDNVLDLIVTNLNDLYNEPFVTAPLGTSDHNVVKWTTSVGGFVRSHVNSACKKHVRRLPQSARHAFGRWCNTHTWFKDARN